MTSKNVIIVLVSVLIIGGAAYYALSQKRPTVKSPAPVTSEKEDPKKSEVVAVPSSSASTDEIIDYIVDGQTADESNAVKNVMDTTSTTQSDEPTISTNF